MGARFSRLVSVAAAGGVLTGSLLLGGGAALAAPAAPAAPGDVVPARCGQTVQASPGDTVQVTPTLGAPFLVPITSAAGPLQSITRPLTGLLCRVQVQLVEPVATAAAAAVPPAAPLASAVANGSRAALDPQSAQPSAAAASPTAAAAAAPAAPVAPMVAPAPALPPAALAAPAFAPAFTGLPSSFLGTPAAGSAPAGLPAYDPGQLLGSAFPGLKAGAPAYLGYDPASAVTTASQVQALPVDGLSGGMGVPVMLAVLALAGVAAFVVRSMVLRRAAGASVAATGPAEPAGPVVGNDGNAGNEDDDYAVGSMEELTARHGAAPESPANGFPAARGEARETELMGTTRR
ncbi:hypothetical protein [Actinomycetospora soli]|uniref:hypothetical protein n=1 Tax=Actinomycetospora soli TaxID=2893887 RepID=UPI001E361BB5|nr:hypothetical protein [Actinomycetospora soli]MCD2186432.1 hypothetical protein [Actinomycetospora soli]